MALTVVVLLLALASLTAASALDCKDLVKPFIPEERNRIFGRWVYAMGAGDPKPYHKALESLKSSWIDLSPTAVNHIVTLRWGDNFNGCILGEVNATVTGLATTFRKNLSDHKGHLLQTWCSDCLLWSDSFRNTDVTGRYILQFSRTGKIDATHVKTFQKQLECLNFPESFHTYDGKNALCPEENTE